MDLPSAYHRSSPSYEVWVCETVQSVGRAPQDGLKALEEEWEVEKGRQRRVMKLMNDRRSVRSGGDPCIQGLELRMELWLAAT